MRRKVLMPLLAVICMIMGLSSCRKTENAVTYVYSPEELDAKALAFKQQIIEEDNKSLTSSESMKMFFEKFSQLEYKAYDGRLPEYAFKLDTASFLSEKNFETIVVKSAQEEAAYNVIYIHGGGWTFSLSMEHLWLVEQISNRINADVYVPMYPMLPRWNNADAYQMLKEVYDKLLQDDKPVILIGDSAGGNMVFGFSYYLRENGVQLPDFLVGISPALDQTSSNAELEEYDKKDIYIDKSVFTVTGPAWAGERKVEDPVISPVYGDPTGFPPTLISVGDSEIMYPDVVRYAENSASKGVKTTVLVGRGLWHVAPIYDMPFSVQFLDCLEEMLKHE